MNLVGTRWRGASGAVATVESISYDKHVVYGRWDAGVPWSEFIELLPKMYVEVDGGPTEERPR